MREPQNPETTGKTIKMEPRRVFIQGLLLPYSTALPWSLPGELAGATYSSFPETTNSFSRLGS